MNKITSINGTFMASLNELNEHTENESIHVTEDERTAWNAKADVSALGICQLHGMLPQYGVRDYNCVAFCWL